MQVQCKVNKQLQLRSINRSKNLESVDGEMPEKAKKRRKTKPSRSAADSETGKRNANNGANFVSMKKI